MVKRPTPSVNHDDDDNDNDRGVAVPRIDPLIRSLLGHLPKPGDVWLPAARDNWMTLLEGAFKVIYKDAEPEKKPGGTSGAQPPTPGSVRSAS